MRKLEFRKILIVGYAFDAADGQVMLHPDGTPMRLPECRVRMRIAFWVPQPEPFQRRHVGTLLDYLKSVVRARLAGFGVAPSLDDDKVTTVEQYMRDHCLDGHLLSVPDAPQNYTLVAQPAEFELQALRDGAIAEQIQDFTFPRWPSMEDLRRYLMPHWEARTVASLGFLPNGAPQDLVPKPALIYESL